MTQLFQNFDCRQVRDLVRLKTFGNATSTVPFDPATGKFSGKAGETPALRFRVEMLAAASIGALKNNFILAQIFLASILNIRILHQADSLRTIG